MCGVLAITWGLHNAAVAAHGGGGGGGGGSQRPDKVDRGKRVFVASAGQTRSRQLLSYQSCYVLATEGGATGRERVTGYGEGGAIPALRCLLFLSQGCHNSDISTVEALA